MLRGQWSALNLGGQLAWLCGQLERGDARQLQAVDPERPAGAVAGAGILAAALGQAGTLPLPMARNAGRRPCRTRKCRPATS